MIRKLVGAIRVVEYPTKLRKSAKIRQQSCKNPTSDIRLVKIRHPSCNSPTSDLLKIRHPSCENNAKTEESLLNQQYGNALLMTFSHYVSHETGNQPVIV